MTNTFEKYGNDFQIKIAYHLIHDEKYASRVMDIMKPDYFSNEFLQIVVREILKYWKVYKTTPSLDTLKTIAAVLDGNSDQMLLGLTLLVDISDSDKAFVIDKSAEFCKQQAMVNAVRKSINLLELEDYEGMFKLIGSALRAGMDVDVGHDYVDDVNGRVASKRFPVSTGFPLLDAELSGGLGSGESGLILGSTGLGKSMLMVWMAAAAAKAGLNVLYYTMELSELIVGLRMDTRITGIPLTELLTDVNGIQRKRVSDKIAELGREMGKPIRFKIKYFPTKAATVGTLRSHIELLKQRNFIPDIIFVDYLDLLKPSTSYSEKRFNLEEISEELRGLAGEYSVPLWTATQNGRSGIDTNIVGLGAIAEAYSKAWAVDVSIGIGRDADLIESDRACYYISKNRLGKTGTVLVGDFITSTLTFSMDTIGLDIEDQKVKSEEVKNRHIGDAVERLMASKQVMANLIEGD